MPPGIARPSPAWPPVATPTAIRAAPTATTSSGQPTARTSTERARPTSNSPPTRTSTTPTTIVLRSDALRGLDICDLRSVSPPGELLDEGPDPVEHVLEDRLQRMPEPRVGHEGRA